MSAFVVDSRTMHRVVLAICARGKYGQIVPRFAGVFTSTGDAPTLIGRHLFALNIEAVQQRYPDTDNMPGSDGAAGMATTYTAREAAHTDSLIDGFKALRCLSYQCSEGDITERALFMELQEAIAAVACHIVESLPAYDKAEW